jgi:O-antigen/teichoic acid export membrane protein
LRGLRHVFVAQIPELLVRPAAHLLFSGFLLIAGILTPALALASQLVAIAIGFLLGHYLLQRLLPQDMRHVQPAYRDREWGRSLLPFALLAAVGILNGQVGIILLGWLGDIQDVAALQIANNGAMLVVLSLTIVNAVIAPHVTRAFRQGDNLVLQKLSTHSARAALLASLPIAIPLLIMPGTIIHLVFGDVYVEIASQPLFFLVIGQLVNVAFGSVGLFLLMAGYERDVLIGQVISLFISVFTGVLLIPHLGVNGAALSMVLGLVFWNVRLAIVFARRLGLRPSAL